MRDVGEWLRAIDLGQYAELFSQNAIDAGALTELNENDLRELGIPVGHRKRILKAIRHIERGGANASYNPQRSERRLLTILFVDIVGSTSLAERLDPEDLANVMNSFHEISSRTVERFGGFVARNLGDGLAAYFGWPESREHDAERAVRTALELITAVKTISIGTDDDLQLHMAVATGRVVVSDVLRLDNEPVQEVFGALPNLAARLQALSPPDSILISEETLRLVEPKFVCVDFGRRKLRGFQESISVSRVIGPRALSLNFEARHGSGLTPLVGRAADIGLMADCWKRTVDGNGQLLLVTGEAGIGKSRLCAELLASIRNESFTRLSFQCSPLHKDSPLYPVARSIALLAAISDDDTTKTKDRKLRDLFGRIEGDHQTGISLLAAYIGITGSIDDDLKVASPDRQRMALHQLLCDLVLALARHQPILVTFEDVHWMDPTTSEFLDTLVGCLSEEAILLVLTCRPAFSPPWPQAANHVILNLGRLTPDQSARLVDIAAKMTELPQNVVAEIIERSDGNPLFIEELTAAVLDRQRATKAISPRSTAASQDIEIPSTLQESLLARIDEASAQTRETIQICAILGRRFSYEQIAAMTDTAGARLDQALAELVHRGLLRVGGQGLNDEYGFKHALLQDAAYSTILREKRQKLHAKCAAMLERRFPSLCTADPRSLATHHELSGSPMAAIPYLLSAGQLAIERSALREADTILQKGLSLLGELPNDEWSNRNELEFRILLGRTCIFTKGWADPSVKSEYRRALDLTEALGLEREQVPLEWALTTHHLLRGEIREAVIGGQRVLELAQQDHNQDLLHVAHSALAIYKFYSGSFIDVISHMDDALRSYQPGARDELHKTFGTDRRLQALRGASLAHWCLGAHETSLALDDEQRALAKGPFESTYALTISCILHALRRDASKTEVFALEAIEIARDQGFKFLEANARNFHAIAAALRQPDEETLKTCEAVIETYQEAGNRMGLSSMLGIMAELCCKIDLNERGLRYVDKALSYAGRSGERFAQADLYRIKGELLGAVKRVDDAERWIRRALALARKQHARTWELQASVALAQLLFARSEPEQAHELLRPWHEQPQTLQLPFEQLLERYGIFARSPPRQERPYLAAPRNGRTARRLSPIRGRKTPF